MENLPKKVYEKFSDHVLLNLSDKYSLQILEGRRRFMGLLPEIHRRRLFEKRGCSSIFEFGAKLGALSEGQVRRALNFDERCEKKNLPLLRKAFTEGEVSINKLARVISLATSENEVELLSKVKVLPKAAVETMVRDFKVENGVKSVPGHMISSMGGELNFSLEIKQKLFELQHKGIDLNQLLGEFLGQRDRKIEQEKQKIVEEDQLRAREGNGGGRYIRARTQNVLKQEFGTKCAIPHCPKLFSLLHHTDRFSLSGANNPYYLAPLCKDHHTLAHSVDRKFHQKRQEALVMS